MGNSIPRLVTIRRLPLQRMKRRRSNNQAISLKIVILGKMAKNNREVKERTKRQMREPTQPVLADQKATMPLGQMKLAWITKFRARITASLFKPPIPKLTAWPRHLRQARPWPPHWWTMPASHAK